MLGDQQHPSYMSPKARGGGGGLGGVSQWEQLCGSKPMRTAVHIT
jgi:hypothetical protein